jgi:hypothetical protein
LKEYSDLQTNLDIIKTQNKQLENDLQIQQQTNQSNLQCIEEYEQTVTQLQQEIDKKDKEIEESTSQLHLNNQHVKYLLLSYFLTSVDKREKLIPLLAAFVGCTEEEYNEEINPESNNNNNGARSESSWLLDCLFGWLSGWLFGWLVAEIFLRVRVRVIRLTESANALPRYFVTSSPNPR